MELVVDVLWMSLRQTRSPGSHRRLWLYIERLRMSVRLHVSGQSKMFQVWIGISFADSPRGLVTEGWALTGHREKLDRLPFNLSSFAPIEWANSFPAPL